MKLTGKKNQRGSMLVEASFMISFILLLLFGALDISRTLNAAIILNQAVFAGAEYATVNPSWSNSEIVSAVTNDAIGVSGPTIGAAGPSSGIASFTAATPVLYCACSEGGAQVSCTSNTCTGTPVKYVQVSASATVRTILAVKGISGNLPVNATCTLRVP